MAQILTNINKEDPKWLVKDNSLQLASIKDGVDASKETVENIQQDLNEIKTKLSLGLSNSDQPKIFNVTPPVKTFTGRERELTQLHDKLQTKQKQVVISQCVSISGLGGAGKSELARKYTHTYHECYGSCIWIDSETQLSITHTFRGLAEELQIPIKQKTFSDERNILAIVEDIYKRFSNSKSLFIFDNVNQFEDIKDFLPPNLSPIYEKPTIIITSRNIDWDIGDDGDVGLVLLDQFTPEEALSYVKKVLEIKEEDKLRDSLISELTKELCCFPLALRQAASYIKTKKCLNSAIENYLVDFRDEKKKRHLMQYKAKRDRYTETTYTTWQITFRNIEKDEANGPLAMRLVEVMAYLAADNIPLGGFIELEKNSHLLNEAVNILLKYSLITVKVNDRIRFVPNFIESFEENDEEEFLFAHDANILRLVQQVIRLWLQEEEREEDVLRTALTRVYDNFDTQHATGLWKYACNYTALINNYFCKICEETKSYNKLLGALNYLVTDGDTQTIRKILNYLEGSKDLWREISYHILNVGFVECRHNDPTMENIGHDIKTLVLFHAELFQALRHSNTKNLELFLQSFDKSLINSFFQDCTALGRSAHCGKLNVVKILTENGADVNSPSWRPHNSTALQVALIENQLKVVEYLLDHGADTNTTNSKGWTALELSCRFGYLNIVKRLIDTIAKCENGTEVNWMPLYLAAENNQVEIVEFLTNHEVYRSAIRDNGQTVCRIAAGSRSIHVVKYLIDSELANVNGRDCKDATLLATAVNNNQFDIIKYLLSDETPDKVNIDAYNVLGCTPFFQAVSHCNIEIARFLFEHGADVNNVRNGGTLLGKLNISALHLAATGNFYLDIVKFLVEECNADINMGLNTSFSPLQVAKCFDNKEVCEFLIRNGADTTEWSNTNLDNITRIIRNFRQENNSAIEYMFRECTSVLDYVKAYNEMHFYQPSCSKERLEALHCCLDRLRLDVCYDQGQQNQEFEQ